MPTDAPICTPDDLHQQWLARTGGRPGDVDRRIWIGIIDADRHMYRNMTYWRLGPKPRQRTVDDLLRRLRSVLDNLEPGTTIALLITRPGRGQQSPADGRWCSMLTATAARLSVPLEPIFRANEDSLMMLEADDEVPPHCDTTGPTYPFAPLSPETLDDAVHSTADLGQRWRTLVGDLGFGERLIWFSFIDSRRQMVKVLHQMDIPREPQPHHGDELFALLRGVLAELPDPTSSVALLLSRPGVGAVSAADRRWATMLTEAATQHGVPIEPIFLANDEALVLLEPARRAA